jgi:hypothetical protein
MRYQRAYFALLIYSGDPIIGCLYGECNRPLFTIEWDYLGGDQLQMRGFWDKSAHPKWGDPYHPNEGMVIFYSSNYFFNKKLPTNMESIPEE